MRVRNHQPQKSHLQKYKQILKSERSYMNPTNKQLQLQKLINFTTKQQIKKQVAVSDQIMPSEILTKTQQKRRESRLFTRKNSQYEVNAEQKYNNKIQQLKLKINFARSRLKRYESLKQKPERYVTQMNQVRESAGKIHSSEHKPRTKSQQGYKVSQTIKDSRRRKTNPAKNVSINPLTSQALTYKNEKLTILTKMIPKLINTLGQQPGQLVKFGEDMDILVRQFSVSPSSVVLTRQISQNLRTILGKLIFFVGYQSFIRFSQDLEAEYQAQQIILGSYYQIYFSMRLGVPLLILQCYEVLMDFALQRGNYIHAQRYAQKCLQASIFYKQKYYEQKSIQKISMCQYYRGNICEATYLHDNNGQVTQESIRKIRDGYNQAEQMSLIFHHLYELPRFDVRQLLLKQDQNHLKGYKAMVVFQSPRIGVDDSMRSKKNQLKIDIMKMQRIKQFKLQAGIMKKQFNRHQNLFTVRKTEKDAQDFKLIKRNLSIDQQNQSSQVLRAHQSLNRLCTINKKPIRNKLMSQFGQFCKFILNKINITAIRINLLNSGN